ncbi:MAG: AAA family ATPase [Solirubrobacterales bacterium]
MSPEPLVTISASYGAGGSRVGPLLAERLGLPFAERVMYRGVADLVAGPLAEARREEPQVGRSLGQLVRQFAAGASEAAPVTEEADRIADEEFRRMNEEEIRGYVHGGGVILGRAAAVVLRDVPHAVHVRMSGPIEARVEQAMRVEDIDRDTARWRQATDDFARDAYVRHFYGLDPLDPALYQLTLDSTRLPLTACVEAIAGAALASAS